MIVPHLLNLILDDQFRRVNSAIFKSSVELCANASGAPYVGAPVLQDVP
jgi:hypothetical protein